MFKAPAIYFPSTVVFLDDDSLYAKLLIHRLPVKNLKHFESSDFLLKQQNADLLFTERVGTSADKIDDIDFLRKNLDNIKRNGHLISVLVSDLYMNGILGTDLFTRLRSPYLGRILMSNFIGYNNNADVVSSTNNDAIDIVLDKTKDFVEQLPKAILAAKNKFFTAISNELFYESSVGHPLSDTEFAKFFLSKIEELQPDEIIPNETLSRFTFTFGSNSPALSFHITQQKEIQSYLASFAAEAAPAEVLSSLSTGRYMLCHEETDDILPDGRLWPLLIRPAKQFETRNNRFFYCITEAEHHVQQ